MWRCCAREGVCVEEWPDLYVDDSARAGGGHVVSSFSSSSSSYTDSPFPRPKPSLTSLSHDPLPTLPYFPAQFAGGVLTSLSTPTTPIANTAVATAAPADFFSPGVSDDKTNLIYSALNSTGNSAILSSKGPGGRDRSSSSQTGSSTSLRPPQLDLSQQSLLRSPSSEAALKRTPSMERYPQQVGLIRDPTPVEDLLTLAKARSNSGSGSGSGSALCLNLSGSSLPNGRSSSRDRIGSLVGNGSGRVAALQVVPEGLLPEGSIQEAESPPAAKPRLFQALPVTDAESECVIKVYSWVPMGVYDDDDLQEDKVLLLYTGTSSQKGDGGGSHLWIGADFDVSQVVDLDEVCLQLACLIDTLIILPLTFHPPQPQPVYRRMWRCCSSFGLAGSFQLTRAVPTGMLAKGVGEKAAAMGM